MAISPKNKMRTFAIHLLLLTGTLFSPFTGFAAEKGLYAGTAIVDVTP
ncbi:uncharacterized protein METZ01_LOCUS230523, partial [marine metagenome]